MEITFFGFIIAGFVAWLMWSSADQKKEFLFYSWAAMLLVCVGLFIRLIHHWLTK